MTAYKKVYENVYKFLVEMTQKIKLDEMEQVGLVDGNSGNDQV